MVKWRYKKWLYLLVAGLVGINIIAAFHAYTFTHFTEQAVSKTKDPKLLSTGQKVKALVVGINNPRPVTNIVPARSYKTIKIQSNKQLEAWLIPADSAKGTVILFHGYSGEKSTMLERAEVFLQLGFNALLVDFMGSGGSEGQQTTLGYLEAEEVKSCFDYLKTQGESRIYLFGTSMGAAAVLKAEHDYHLQPSGLILECPFGSMYATTCARFHKMGVPAFPMAGLLVFWGGLENGFWAYGHNPVNYARAVNCPVLLLYGAKDETVSQEDTELIFANLTSNLKELRVYPNAAHENFLLQYSKEWTSDVQDFLVKTQ